MFSFRKTIFWLLDRFKGGKIKKEYDDIKCIFELSDGYQEKIDMYTSDLLQYAAQHTNFYCSYKNKKLSEFPVVNKSIIKDHIDDISSDEYKGKQLHEMHTSGSTGTPFVSRQNEKKRNRVLAELIYFGEKAGYQLGERYIFFRVWMEANKKSKIESFKQNLIPVDILHLDDDNLEQIRLLLLKDQKIKYLLAYASTYDKLSKYLEKWKHKPEDFSIHTIISSSEVLQSSTRERLKRIFGCNVISRYSNQENGILAQDNTVADEYEINNASYVIEILRLDSDEPVSEGETGRIVVTDLFNYAMPFIRYDTGDVGTLSFRKTKSGDKIPIIKCIGGRMVDMIYDTKGTPLTPHTWSVYMWKFDKLNQYQFIQNGERDYLLKINVQEGVYTDEELAEHLKSVLGQDANIEIQRVSDIPVLASGKFKKTVCNYKKDD